MTTQNLLVELFVEELPPKALSKLGESFSQVLTESLKSLGLIHSFTLSDPSNHDLKRPHHEDVSICTAFASPRRLAVHVTHVLVQAPDKAVSQKLMPVAVGLDTSGQATPALLKKLQALGADASAVASLKRAMDGKAEALFFENTVRGVTLTEGLQKALDEAIAKLPIPKVMSYQLERDCALPGWTSVSFVRPAHRLLALHGANVVPIHALGLTAGNTTQGHRFEAAVSPVTIAHADEYDTTLQRDGAVIASFTARKAEIARQLQAAAQKVGAQAVDDDGDDLLNEVTGLVERPNVLVCEFEKQFLEVPQECLTLTMKANQKYFPLLDAAGKLMNQFLVVSNITPADASEVIGGNERVVRPRLADAKFFYDQDRKKTLESRVKGLSKVVYHNKLGSQGERMKRVCEIARLIGQQLGGDVLAAKAVLAARLAKTDLLTDMVGEFPELQGIMGNYYAKNDGLGDEIATAISDHYCPRFAGDWLPTNMVGVSVALADKLETLVGMFGIGNVPTGDKDPFALRRHALGVNRMLIEKNLALDIDSLLDTVLQIISENLRKQIVEGGLPAIMAGDSLKNVEENNVLEGVVSFIYDRLSGSLREQGFSAQEVDAVLALRPQRLGEILPRLNAVRAFSTLAESPALAAANKRIGNILKKAGEVDAQVNPALLQEGAEKNLYAVMQKLLPTSEAQFQAGDYTASLQTLAALRAPVDAFFDDVMVNADDMDVRRNRQGLLKSLHVAMNRVADLARLAS
jgi:glycyl-tRNA synthetase beta chain